MFVFSTRRPLSTLGAIVAIVLTASYVEAQPEEFPRVPEPSPHCRVTQTLALSDVSIDYSRPSLKGREIFGTLVPWETVWRTGANASTKLELDEELLIEGHRVPAGTYSLLSIPGKERWTIILNEDTSLWGHYGYDQTKDLLRFEVPLERGKDWIETLDIAFTDVSEWAATVEIRWGDYRVPFKLEVDKEAVDARIMADIESKLAIADSITEPVVRAHVYFFAADYYFETGRDLEQALAWMNQGIEIEPVNYFFLYQSKILGKLGRYDEAIDASKRGLDMFLEGGTNKEWIYRYEQQIAGWERVQAGS